MDSNPPGKLPPTVTHLMQLPRELVHKVMDDLCLSQVLALALYNVPHIEECILSQFDYKRFFKVPSKLHSLSEYFGLYTAILSTLSIAAKKDTPQLAAHPKSSRVQYGQLVSDLHVKITDLIDRLTPTGDDFAVLARTSPTPLKVVWNSSTLSHLKSRWILLNDLTRALNLKKAEQLQKLCELVDAHPRALKGIMDPSQEPRNISEHTKKRLNWYAKEFLRPRNSLSAKPILVFKYGLPVVPYDRYLCLFLKVLKKHPLPDLEVPAVTLPAHRIPTTSVNVPQEENPKTIFAPKHSEKTKTHEYTPEAIENIQRAIFGLTYTYTQDSESFIPPAHSSPMLGKETVPPETIPPGAGIIRTKHTPYSAHSHKKARHPQPCFALTKRTVTDAPLPDMEIQWLELFLWSCDYMSKMSSAKWTSEMSVAEMWHKKLVYVDWV